jgi:hypothetical protein
MIDIETFWKILNVIKTGTADSTLTTALNNLALSNQSTAETLFSNRIDQSAFNTADYTRLRAFIRDWYASFRTGTASSRQISDPYSRSNDELDELFRSFGYDFSTSIRGPSSDPVTIKVNFFLDLVNLYKIKGTPQAILEVLQYYGINDLDIYELWCQKNTENSLIFRGDIAAGTTGDTASIQLPFDLLTQGDPHWRYTEGQILTLDRLNKINLPSKSPYFAIKPIYDPNSASLAILQRKVQDQHDIWSGGGSLPQDAEVSIVGGRLTSLLGLYLSCVYVFNNEFNTGVISNNNFFCYDGTTVDTFEILDEYNAITQRTYATRAEYNSYLAQYYDLFTRADVRNFLQAATDAGDILAVLDPTLKNELDSVGEPNIVILASLLKDLGDWIKYNINFGFINIALILSGLDLIFDDLKNAINFFKPYHARLVPLEALNIKNRLFGSIVMEDQAIDEREEYFYDYITGDGAPCCDSTNTTCYDTTSAGNQYYARDTFDCGSNFDIGAVVDGGIKIYEEITFRDNLRCPQDSTGPVVSEITDLEMWGRYSRQIPNAVIELDVRLEVDQTDTNYSVVCDVWNEEDPDPSIYDYIITRKSTAGFTVRFSDYIDGDNYWLDFYIRRGEYAGIESLVNGSTQKTVLFGTPKPNTQYALGITLRNIVDATPSMFNWEVIQKQTNGFKVQFSDTIDTNNHYMEWIVVDSTASGIESLSNGAESYVVTLPYTEQNDDYAVILEVKNTIDASSSIYTYIITEKTTTSFTVEFSGPMDSPNYTLCWFILPQELEINRMDYYQSGHWHDFDDDGTFDCTHGFDLVQIYVRPIGDFLLQENGFYLLQENGDRIVLEGSE